jgi:hypothetical protein
MVVYTNGCSHTAGGCMKFQHTWPLIIMKSIMKANSYTINPNHLELFKFDNILYNQAMHGAGNDYIFHTSLETISNLISNNKKPNHVIIQWSGPNRRLHTQPDGTILFINPWDSPELGVKFEPMGSEHTIHYMFALQEFLKKNEIDYWFFNYMQLDKSIKKLEIYRKIDFTRFVNFGMGDSIIFNGLIDFFKSKNLCCDEQGHPNQDANFIIAKQFLDKAGIEMIEESEFLKTSIL